MPAESTPVTSRVTTPSQQSGKPSMASRISGKQDDDNQRRSQPPPKAWGSGVNPITQRANTSSQANGSASKSNSKSVTPDISQSHTMDKVQDRHIQAISHAMGLFCTVATKDGGQYVGIPVGVKGKDDQTQIQFQNVRRAGLQDYDRPQKSVAKPQYAGDGPQHTLAIPAASIAFFLASDAAGTVRSGQGKGFKTDVEISGNSQVRERKLERWVAPSNDAVTFTDSARSGEFDQFKVNEQKFGVKSTYNEEEYTTRLDRSSASYAQREAKAARLAAEIQGDVKSNAWSEQRGVNDEGYDEEDLYSGVRRDQPSLQSNQANRYVPPSRRSNQPPAAEADSEPTAPTVQATNPKEKIEQLKEGQKQDTGAAQKSVATAEKGPSTSKAAPASTAIPASAASKPGAPAPIQTQTSAASKAPHDVAVAFKQFANLEKLKVQNSRHIKNQQDKAVKVNDLKKFAKNFKLHTPVPKDLLPILAKDEAKQNEIVKKAQEQHELKKKTQVDPQSNENNAGLAKRQSESAASGAQAKAGVQAAGGSNPPSNTLSQRLESTRRQHKNGAAGGTPPTLPIHETRQARQSSYTSGMPSLTSPTKVGHVRGAPSNNNATKLNAQVPEFRPNPMAAQFKPGSSVSGTTNVSSPSSRPITRTITPVASSPTIDFLKEAKARDHKGVSRRPITWQLDRLNTIKPREEENKFPSSSKAESAGPKEESAPVIQQPYKQKVDWVSPSLDDAQISSLPKYRELFARERMSRPPSFAASPGGGPRGPHPMQYPVQNGGPNMPGMPMAGQMAPHMQGQPHHYPQPGHFDDHQMRPSPSQAQYPGPSPRMHHAYPSPMPHANQMGYNQGPYMSQGPNMPPRQYSNGPGGMPGPHMQPPMMHGQPYMQQPMMPMQPHPQYGQQGMYPGVPQTNGFPSPGRAAPPMMPSSSHQGHPGSYTPNGQYAQPAYHPPPGQMMPRGSFNGQPNYPQSPYQQHPYPARTPSHGYAQPHQQPNMMTPQAPPVQPAVSANEDAK